MQLTQPGARPMRGAQGPKNLVGSGGRRFRNRNGSVPTGTPGARLRPSEDWAHVGAGSGSRRRLSMVLREHPICLYQRDTRNLDGGLEVIAGIGGAGRRTFRERWPIRLSRRDTSAINAERSSIRRRHSACLLPRGPLCAAAVWAKPRPFPIPSLC